MPKQCSLRDATGAPICKLEICEAESLVEKGKAIRLSEVKRIYRMVVPLEPSKSPDTACCLGMHDMDSLAGLVKMGARERERLTGYGFFPFPEKA